MTTAEALEGITDAGMFEILATRVLRELEADCRAVAHIGVNAQGKTIANPVDGFCLVPGSSPPRYVMTAFATTTEDALERKWLFDHATALRAKKATAADDGDLIKAAKQAASIRTNEPSATFAVHLCTNRRLDPGLMQTVYAAAAKHGMTVVFLDQSRLRDFLDTKPEGQWLRKEHLRIEADQLSLSLMKQLSNQSQELYAAEIMLPARTEIVATGQAVAVRHGLADASKPLRLLVGPSGAGKSVLAHEVLGCTIQEGGIGLWLPSEAVAESVSLKDAIERTVRAIHPSLGARVGEEVLRLSSPENPLVLVIDDINRFGDPRRLLEKSVAWARPATSQTTSGSPAPSSLRILCPVWDSTWHFLKHGYKSESWLAVAAVERMSRDESVACIRAALGSASNRFTDPDLGTYAERMGDDPILLALFGRLLREMPDANPLVFSADVIGQFVDKSIGELAVARGVAPIEYLSALEALSEELIRHKILYPQWSTLQDWHQEDPRTLDALSQLARQGHVCRITATGRFEFRHDRLLEHFLSGAAARLLAAGGHDRDLLNDPFYVAIIGRAIARGGVGVNPGAVTWVSTNQPVGLIAALPYLPSDGSEEARLVVTAASAWLKAAGGPGTRTMFDDARSLLLTTDAPYVLQATEEKEEDLFINQARLRNGDAVAGINAVLQYPEFSPSVHDYQLENIISQGKRRHGSKLIKELGAILRHDGLDDVHRGGALILAGYLGNPEMIGDIRLAWEKTARKDLLLRAGLWAGLRCSAADPEPVLDPMFDELLKVSNAPDQYGRSSRKGVVDDLRFTSRHGFSEQVLAYLVRFGTRGEDERDVATRLLDNIDHPIAVDFVARQLAESEHQANQSGGFSLWASTWRPSWDRDQGRALLSPDSLQALRSIWEDARNPEWQKRYAFRVWARLTDDLESLKQIGPDSPFRRSSLWSRAERGDRSVAAEVLPLVENDRNWLRVIAEIWSPEFEPVIDVALNDLRTSPDLRSNSKSNEQYDLSGLLRDIPTEVAEGFIEKYWADLKSSPLFIQAALYVGTDRCRALAQDALRENAAGDKPFEHIHSFFGFKTTGRSERLNARHLETLLPYLPQLDDLTVGSMVEHCRKFGPWEWAIDHLRPEVSRRAESAPPDWDKGPGFIARMALHWFPTDENLIAELDRAAAEDERFHWGTLSRFWEDSLERGDDRGRPFRIIEEWLRRSPTIDRLRIAIMVVRAWGERPEIELVRRYYDPAAHAELSPLVAEMKYAVMRRSLE